MAIDFPASPTPNQLHTAGSRSWSWNNSVGAWYAVNAGVQGIQGIQGTQGTQGLQGITGSQGTQGTQGSQGIQGTQGIQGLQGITGSQGTQGTQGIQGLQGTAGFVGSNGTQGTQGQQGIQGIQGITGSQGITGAQGITGTNGTQGAQGTVGSTGAQGITGTQGAVGSQGSTGSQGTIGTSVTGAQGTTGASILGTANTFTSTNAFSNSVFVNSSADITTLAGILTLYSTGNTTTSQIMFKNTTGLGYGNHGAITGGYNTYFVMDTTDRGWIFRNATTAANVASISNTGVITATTFSGALSGNAATATLAANSTLAGGFTPTTAGTASTICVRDASNHLTIGGYYFGQYINTTDDISTGTISHIVAKFGENYHRSATAAKVATFLSGQSMNISGSSTSCSGNAATVTNATFYRQFTMRDDRSDGNDYSLSARATGLYAISGAGSSGPGSGYLSLLHISNGTDVAFQIAGGYTSDNMYFRGTSALQNGTGYTPWRTVLHSGNYSSYALPLSGGTITGAVNFPGGSVIAANGDITARRSSGTTGVVYFGNGSQYLYYDGGNWTLQGGTTLNIAALACSNITAAGAITATGNITAYYSDDRLKTRLGSIDNALNKVLSLNGFYFEANETAQALGYTKKKEVGVSAQEVELVLPEIIAPAPIDAQYKTLDYGKLVPLLIEAIKDLNAKVDSLQTQLNNK